MQGKDIEKTLDYLRDACAFVEIDCEACGGCPLRHAYCMHEVPISDFAELSASIIDEFLNFAHDGRAEAWRFENMSEYERKEEVEAELSNVERSSYDD